MHNIWLIAKREYTERIRTRGFLMATILIPLLMGGAFWGMVALTGDAASASHIAILSSQPQLAADLKAELESGKNSRMTVDVLPASTPHAQLDREIEKKQIDGYLVIVPAAAGERPTFDFTSRSTADIATSDALQEALQNVLTREYLADHGISSAQTATLLEPVTVNILDKNGERGNSHSSFYVAYALFFLMYLVVLLYGMNVARSIIEEKTSRVFEVLLATIKPDELLAGKILGVGAVGLTQVGIWMTAAGLLALRMGAASGIQMSVYQAIYFVVYFVLGYGLYSSVAAALGAMTNSEQELQQLNMFLMLPLFFSLLMMVPVVTNPNSILSRVVSQIPFCAPLLMEMRVSVSMPRPWEIALSIGLILVTIYAVLWVSSRIYRVGILMYGKKPNLPEILRWLKYS